MTSRDIAVLPSLAKRIGLNESIVLQRIHSLLLEQHTSISVDGRRWVSSTYKQWQEHFPFWSVRTIERTFRSLESSGIVVSSMFEESEWNRTKSYTIDYSKLEA